MKQSHNMAGRPMRWTNFSQIVPPQPSFGLQAQIEDYITHTAKHLDQMRSAAMAYKASNNKPQD